MNFFHTLYVTSPEKRPDIAKFFDIIGVQYGILSPGEPEQDTYPIVDIHFSSPVINDAVSIRGKFPSIAEWCPVNITLYTISDTCPVCEVVKERLKALGVFFGERPASAIDGYEHFPIMKINGRDDILATKDVMLLVNALEAEYGNEGIPA